MFFVSYFISITTIDNKLMVNFIEINVTVALYNFQTSLSSANIFSDSIFWICSETIAWINLDV